MQVLTRNFCASSRDLIICPEYHAEEMSAQVGRLSMAQKTGVQSQVETYQRLKNDT